MGVPVAVGVVSDKEVMGIRYIWKCLTFQGILVAFWLTYRPNNFTCKTMVKLFTNRELSSRLDINPARWKRWSREFLPPDPLAGRQSGYARQYYLNDAFIVYLGGHLVAALRLSIPEARRMLSDLQAWLRENGYRFDPDGSPSGSASERRPALDHTITAYPSVDGGFAYRIKTVFEEKKDTLDGIPVCCELFHDAWIGAAADNEPDLSTPITIAIRRILKNFLTAVDPDGHQFPQLYGIKGDRPL